MYICINIGFSKKKIKLGSNHLTLGGGGGGGVFFCYKILFKKKIKLGRHHLTLGGGGYGFFSVTKFYLKKN